MMKSNKKSKWKNARTQREAWKYHKKGWLAYYFYKKEQMQKRMI